MSDRNIYTSLILLSLFCFFLTFVFCVGLSMDNTSAYTSGSISFGYIILTLYLAWRRDTVAPHPVVVASRKRHNAINKVPVGTTLFLTWNGVETDKNGKRFYKISLNDGKRWLQLWEDNINFDITKPHSYIEKHLGKLIYDYLIEKEISDE